MQSEQAWEDEMCRALRRDMARMAREPDNIVFHWERLVWLSGSSLAEIREPLAAPVYKQILAVHALLSFLGRLKASPDRLSNTLHAGEMWVARTQVNHMAKNIEEELKLALDARDPREVTERIHVVLEMLPALRRAVRMPPTPD